MLWSQESRRARHYGVGVQDQRGAFERDRDRILYSSAFRRLAGITQIVRAGEADVFHTRQQHTLKVAQVGRRLAQSFNEKTPKLCEAAGMDAEVVEAACLAHDLGHPPFGHIGEKILDKLVVKNGDPDGFEGNAQTFRILTKSAIRFEESPGLDLTRATLAACLKYPWTRNVNIPSKATKWGAYRSEQVDFEFARELFDDFHKTPEAELMDWSDDIAYSVHDLEDFHRCGALPWHRILSEDASQDLVKRAFASWYDAPPGAEERLSEAFQRLRAFLRGSFAQLINEPYEGSRPQRQQLRTLTSTLINRYITATNLTDPLKNPNEGRWISVGTDEADEVKILKQITRDYIIGNPSLAAQQKGQGRILTNLYNEIFEASETSAARFLPVRLRYLWELCGGNRARFAADCVAGLTEAEAVGMHARFQGLSAGSVLDPIVR